MTGSPIDAEDALSCPCNKSEETQGQKNEYRLRVGNYRVLFELEGKRIVVYTIGPRKDIYQ